MLGCATGYCKTCKEHIPLSLGSRYIPVNGKLVQVDALVCPTCSSYMGLPVHNNHISLKEPA